MSPPNLLFLITDQQRADTIGAHTACQTPNLDRLAAAGSQCVRCYTPNPICSPTRASLMTGLLPHSHGRSLLPLLQGRENNWRSEAFAECHGQRFNYTQRVLWRGDDKYIFNGFDEDELYDLAADPHEMHNLAGDRARRSVLESMSARMWEIMRQTSDSTMTQAQYGMFRFAPVGPESDR
jgi:arylsulfatase A-like enzyme